MKKKRLDDVLIEKKFAKDKQGAFVLVTAGNIFVDGQKAVTPAQLVLRDTKIEVRSEREYVGRGAYKLEGALKEFSINVEGKICADIGSATGGFVEVLLKHGAKKVYAIDTARGKLDLRLREDPRVVVMEDTNALYLESLADPIDYVTIDVSLTSLRFVMPVAKKILKKGGAVIALFKPQYEVDKKYLKHGIVEDNEARKKAFDDFIRWVEVRGWSVQGNMESPIKGSEGNVEYLIFVTR